MKKSAQSVDQALPLQADQLPDAIIRYRNLDLTEAATVPPMTELSPLTPYVPEWLLGLVIAATLLAGLAVALVLIVLLIRHQLRRAK